MARVLLDTTVVIDLLRGSAGAIGRLRALKDSGDIPYVCAINVEETVRGLRPRDQDPAARLFAGLRIAPLGSEEGWQAGAWRRAAAARGRTLSQSGCLIAAVSLALGGRLATGNPKDFPMRELTVEHWPAGE